METFKKKSKTGFWLVYHFGVLFFSIIVAMLTKYSQTGNAFVPETILVAATIFTMSVLMGYLSMYFVNMGTRLSYQDLSKKIVPAFILFLATVFMIANIVVSLGVFIWYVVNDMNLDVFLSNLFKYELSFANKSLFVWLLFFSIAFFYILWKKSSQKEQKLREENLKFRYQTLKSQVNPHFLFNSFNTLSELINSDVKKADAYLQKLSGIYRYVLDNEDKDLVPLEDEIDFVRQYFNLQKERDDEKIFLTINYEGPRNFRILPVSLQLLVENALKHNSASREKPLKINITLSDGFIVVSNNIQRKNILGNSTQKGLLNLTERVKLILDKDMVVSESNDEFVVKLPIVYQI